MNPRVRQFVRSYLEKRHAVLFFSLLLSLVVVPVLAALGFSSTILEAFLLLNILLAATGAEKRGRALFLVVVGVVFAARLIGLLLGSRGVSDGASFAVAALMLSAAVSSFRFAMRSKTVDSEHIYAALSAYLLAAQFFGILATTLEQVVPGSYSGASLTQPGSFPIPQGIYFSFVTIATLGYGDIVPATDLSRGITVVEAVAGQLYIAVLVARLVSGYGAKGAASD